MKNNKLLYLLTIFITLFTFNINANAAHKLICLYEKENENLTLAFIQDGNVPYKQYVLENEKNKAKIDDSGWKKTTSKINFNDYSFANGDPLTYEGEGIFTKCPGSIINRLGEYRVYEGPYAGAFKLYDSYIDKDIKIKYEDFGTIDNPINGKSCSQLLPDEKWLQTSNNWDNSKYQMGCLYQKSINNQCHVIQINYGKKARTFIDSMQYGNSNSNISVRNEAFSVDMIKEKYKGTCPQVIMVAIGTGERAGYTYIDQTKSEELLDWKAYRLVNNTGKNILTDEELTMNELIIKPTGEIKNCSVLFGEDESMLNVVRTIINLVKIFIPIVLIGLGTFDFALAIFAGEEDKMKKAQKKFINRVIIAVAIFLVPSLLKMILTIANSIWPNIDATLCDLI